ncbi:hypothetical protein [Fulvimarina sp. MAC8]|uniref:hypothetical protein n=1 Tax=Fulvimarina sp. MAC8 TaxID=3162874 RepID=UPI0032EB76CE
MTIELNVPLDDALKADLDAEARASNQTASHIAEQDIASYLASRRSKREAVRQAISEAGQGRFVSKEAVDRWISTWSYDGVPPPPKADIFVKR